MRYLFAALLAGALLLPGILSAQPTVWRWANQIGYGETTATAADAAGNFYVAGRFTGGAGFGATYLTSTGGEDLFVAKVRPDGTYMWAVQANGIVNDAATALAVDAAGNVTVAGEFSGTTLTFGTGPGAPTATNSGSRTEMFVARLSSGGIWQWAASAGGLADDLLTGVALDGGGNAYVTGRLYSQTAAFGSTTVTTAGNGDAFVAKLSPAGVWQWAVNATGTGEDNGAAIAADPSGNVYVTGIFRSPDLDFGTITLTGGNRPGGTPYVARLDATGAWQWAQVLETKPGRPAPASGTGLTVDPTTGDAVLVGSFSDTLRFGTIPRLIAQGEEDVFVVRLSAAGVARWAASGGGSGPDWPTGVTLDDMGHVLLTGTFASPAAAFGGTTLSYTAAPGSFLRGDVFVTQLSGTGFWHWAVQTTSPAAALNTGLHLAVNFRGQLVVVGSFRSPSLTFGQHQLTNPTGQVVGFLAGLSPAGVGLPDESGASSFTLVPNPAHHTVRLTGATAGPVQVLDALGRVVKTASCEPRTANLEMDVEGLPAGLYLVRCGSGARKLVVE